MKKLRRMLLMAFVLTVGASLTSCGDIVSPDNPVEPTPTPTPTPEPTPEPEPTPTPTPTPQTVVTATDLLQDAQKEGATVVYWYVHDNQLYRAIFKKETRMFIKLEFESEF